MKTRFIILACAALIAVSGSVMADDLLGKGKGSGGGGGGNQSGGGSTGGGGGSKPPEPPPTRGGNNNPPQSPPPVRGGNNSGNNSGNQGGGGLGKGPGNSGGGSTSGGNSSGGTRPPQGAPTRDRDREAPRVNNGSNRGGDELLGRRGGGQSRSGEVNYGTRNNQVGSNGNNNAPNRAGWEQVPDNSAAATRARRVGEVNQNFDNQFRNGYYHYDRTWRDDYFWYPHYTFQYRDDRCVPSPFYHYPHLPAYINVTRISWGGSLFVYDRWDRYEYGRQTSNWWGNSSRGELDEVVDDITEAFRRQNIRYLGFYIPSRNRVTIQVENTRSYTVSSDDYYDMMRDLVEGTRTRNFTIRDIRWNRNTAVVIAEHEYRDTWNRTERNFHVYGLQQGRRGWEITNFRITRRW